jgi:CBS domain-containing protein
MSARAAWRLETLGYADVNRYVAGKVDWLANGLPSEGDRASEPRIGALANTDVPTCGLRETVGEVRRRLAGSDGGDLCVVVNSEKVILGDLRGKALKSAADDALVDDVLNPGTSTYRPNVSVEEMARHLGETRARRVLVSDADGHLLGLLRREDVDRAFHAQHAEHAEHARHA